MLVNLLQTPLGRLRVLGFLEGLSYLALLGVAVPLKYLAHMPAATRGPGAVHGLLFVAYVFALIQTAIELRWSFGTAARSFVASLLPFGTFYAERAIFQPATAEEAIS